MFKKILLVYKDGLDERGLDSLKKVEAVIERNKGDIIDYAKLTKRNLGGHDLVVTFGGDGTFVKTANLIDEQFILGINSEPNSSEGHLTSINIEQLELLKKILDGEFKIILRQRAKVKLNDKFLEEQATNEVYVGAVSQFHSSRYMIRFRDVEEEQRSSGVIVATGTGSKAWFKSAGGIPFRYDDKKLHFIVREPYFGERLFKPKFLHGEIHEGEKLVLESRRNFGGVIAINEAVYDFNHGDIVEVSLSDKALKVLGV